MCLFTIPATCRSLGMWFHIKLWFGMEVDRKSTRLNSSHTVISYAVFCLKKKKPLRPRVRIHEALHELETLLQFLANLFRFRRAHRILEFFVELVEIYLAQKFQKLFRAHS